MILSSSIMTAAPGKAGALMPHIAKYREEASAGSGKEFSAWVAMAGHPFGTYTLTASFDGAADMVESFQKLMMHEPFHAVSAEAGGLLAHPAENNQAEIIHMTGEPAGAKPLAVVTTATMATGRVGAAGAWAVEIMEYLTKLTGIGGLVMTSWAGTMFQMGWVIQVDSAAQIDDVNAKLAVDEGYRERLDNPGNLFVSGSSSRGLYARMP